MRRGPVAIVLEPTRELALQVEEECNKFNKYIQSPSINVACFVGGIDDRDIQRVSFLFIQCPISVACSVACGVPFFQCGATTDDVHLQSLKRGVDILVGTPSRIADLLRQSRISLAGVRFFVMDEADRLVQEADTLSTVVTLYEACCTRAAQPQTLLFSATLHSVDFQSVAQRLTQHAIWVDLKGKNAVPEVCLSCSLIFSAY